MQIYHYTSIETLALILSFKRLRFNRIDNMDDLRECEGLPEGLSKNLYLSCWTADPVENIVLWGMYTANRGIRIEFPRTFYNNYIDEFGLGSTPFPTENIILPLPYKESFGRHISFTSMSTDEHGFWTEVEYCSDAKEKKVKMWQITEDGEMRTDHARNLVRYKDDQWQYQKEFRFFLYGHANAGHELPDYIDVPINDDVLNNIIVRLHPNAETPSKLLVDALLEKYTTSGKTEESSLNGIVRPKKV